MGGGADDEGLFGMRIALREAYLGFKHKCTQWQPTPRFPTGAWNSTVAVAPMTQRRIPSFGRDRLGCRVHLLLDTERKAK